MLFRHHFGKVNEQLVFMIWFYNAQGTSNCIKILPTYIHPISLDFNQRIPRKNALLIVSINCLSIILIYDKFILTLSINSFVSRTF